MNKKFNILSNKQLLALSILLLACSLTSCNDDIAGEDTQLSSQEISVTTSLDNTQAGTRALCYDSDNLTSDRMHLYVYYNGKNTDYFDTGVMYRDNTWQFYNSDVLGLKYFWPVYGTLDFFAYFDKNSDNEDLSTKVNLTTSAGSAPTFKYDGGTSITETYASATATPENSQSSQKEFICAYTKNVGPGSNGNVNLTFHRPFSLVCFTLDESIRCTISSIKITGIQNSGDATISDVSPYATWTTSGDGIDFTVTYTNGLKYPGDVNSGAELAQPVIVVPQVIPPTARIEVEYKALGSANTTKVSSALNAATIGTNKVTTWEPGNRYNYGLKLNGAANEIFVGVSVTAWTVEGTSEGEVK